MTVAFAFSGGGNFGPMQAGAVVALLEAGVAPDLLVGSSVGALNAAFLSSRPGISGAQSLVDAWTTCGAARLLPSARSTFSRVSSAPAIISSQPTDCVL